LLENTPYAETSYVWFVAVPWFQLFGGFLGFGHRICGGKQFQGEPTKIAEEISNVLDTDATLRRLVFQPVTPQDIIALHPNIIVKPDNYHPGKVFDLAVLLALDGQKNTSLSLLRAILAGDNPITYREHETEITRSVVHCLENDQPLQPILDPLIAANKARWPIKAVKPRRLGHKPRANKPSKSIAEQSDESAKQTFTFTLAPPKPTRTKI